MFSKTKTTVDPLVKIEKRRRFWRKARRRFFWTVAVVLVLHTALNIYSSIMLNREYAYIREKGDPLRFAELKPPSIPDNQNAAPVYLKASSTLKLSSEEKTALNIRKSRRTPQDNVLITAALQKNAPALELARQAAAMPGCQFPLNWEGDPMRLLFPHYGKLRELARLLSTDAGIKNRQGDHAAALRDAKAIFGMSHHLTGEPYLIGFLVARSVNAIGQSTLAQTLDSSPLTVAQARAFQASLPQDDWAQVFHHTLIGERSMGIYAFESITKPLTPSMWSALSSPDGSGIAGIFYLPVYLFWRPFLKLDQVQGLRLWKRLIDSPESQQMPRPQGFGQAQTKTIQNLPFYAILSKILFPVFTNSTDNRDAVVVQDNQREVALALTSYRTIHGAYPKQLKEAETLWGKPFPLDPYSQKPFGYRREADSFVLYSVGLNRTDDGGKDRYLTGAGIGRTDPDLVWPNSLQKSHDKRN
ncbi:hypothetical protein EON80_12610 [bacterium]|nr:MAG: hypothetical protein EON80_12610 [bacterium]